MVEMDKPLAGCRFAFDRPRTGQREMLIDAGVKRLVSAGGGIVERTFNKKVTHFVCTPEQLVVEGRGTCARERRRLLKERRAAGVFFVTRDWVEDCVRDRARLPEAAYVVSASEADGKGEGGDDSDVELADAPPEEPPARARAKRRRTTAAEAAETAPSPKRARRGRKTGAS